ncbi:hypothetical protein CANINC_000973 [Pichia inconspicua]|uniref:Uncharacterized protein n=1 Tax=Pichia inconspicua TaxID=52247 RepID=A0A4T0X639_9ASCO|nr:hypothetical protein CANINC_000973 [[Candida] inconspicua]
MKLLHTIETLPNPNGLIALSTDSTNNFLAYPSSQKVTKLNGTGIPQFGVDVTALNGQQVSSSSGQGNTGAGIPKSHDEINRLNTEVQTQSVRNGDVVIFDCKLLQPITVIEAHKTQLAAMAFSQDGTLLATASDKGTIIRVFSVKTGVKLYQFRRGLYNTKIYSLAFSPSNMFLIASSATGTVHIFRLGEQEAKNTIIRSSGSSGWINYKKSANDKSLEATRQEELDRLMKSRQSKLESHDILSTLNETDELDNKKDDDSPDLLQFQNLDLNSDSEDEVESLLDIEEGEEEDIAGEARDEESTSNVSTSITKSMSSTGSDQKTQPTEDNNRRSVARMLRRTSQKLGRKAAEKMGTYLPPKFSSILEPNRHFASLKVPSNKESMTIVGVTETTQDVSDLNDNNSVTSYHQPHLHIDEASSTHSSNSLSTSVMSRLRHLVVTIEIVSAEGIFYTYRLDPERGGDCALLSQRSLFE